MTEMTLEQAMRLAHEHHHAGRMTEAEHIYRQVLKAAPNYAGALHALGILAGQSGRGPLAVELISQAIAQRPDFAQAHANLSIFLTDLRRFDEAIAAARRAIDLNPDAGESHSNLGNALRESGKLDEALQAFDRAAALKPDIAEIHANRGAALAMMGRTLEAIESYRRSISLKPTLAMAHNNLGNALRDLGQTSEAVAVFRELIRLHPNFAEGYYNLANALLDQREFAEAIDLYRKVIVLKPRLSGAYLNMAAAMRELRKFGPALAAVDKALELDPNYAQAHSNRGALLHDMGKVDQAVAALRRAIELQPDLPQVHVNLGNSLKEIGKIDEAIACFHRGLELDPRDTDARINLAVALSDREEHAEAIAEYEKALMLKPGSWQGYNNMGSALKEEGRLDEALAAFRRALGLKPDFAAAHSNLVYTIAFHQDYDAKKIFAEARAWALAHERPLMVGIQPHRNSPSPSRKLKIGYVSADFREHVVGRNLLPLISNHDHRAFEVYCYSNCNRSDSITDSIRKHSDHWRDIYRQSDESAAAMIRNDGIDILVDLTLHMAGSRLLTFARKPAPLQLTYLGYCGTTGLDTIDYRFSDPFMDPQEMDLACYSEQTIHLPRTYWCYFPPISPAVSSPPSATNGFVTFGCLNNIAKISPASVDLWIELMNRVENSRLILHAPPGVPRQRLLDRFTSGGISADRVEFVARLPLPEYARCYDRIDIALDPFPYGGGITTCDSLWLGVPVVTLNGGIAVGRGGASVLTNAGLPDCIAGTHEEYLSIAQNLASDEPRRAELRQKLRAMMQASPLLDAPGFARDVETSYRRIWTRWCEGRS